MSCCRCNRSPCCCVISEALCPTNTEYSFVNGNLAGVGTLDGVASGVVTFRGIRSTNGNIVVAENAALNTVDLTIDSSTFSGTQTFANAAARALTVPEFDGQYGVQLDTGVPYLSTGTNAGDWTPYPWLLMDVTNTPIDTGTTTIDLTIGNTGSASVVFTLGVASALTITTSSVTLTNNTMVLDDLQVTGNAVFSANLNMAAGSVLQSVGVDIPANSVLITAGTDGEFSSALISTYVSNANTAAYVQPTGTASRAGFATYTAPAITNPPTQAEVQDIADALEEVSQHLKALIDDLAGTLKPDY